MSVKAAINSPLEAGLTELGQTSLLFFLSGSDTLSKELVNKDTQETNGLSNKGSLHQCDCSFRYRYYNNDVIAN